MVRKGSDIGEEMNRSETLGRQKRKEVRCGRKKESEM